MDGVDVIMSMDYGANFAVVISHEDLGKIVPQEYNNFFAELVQAEVHFDTFAQVAQYGLDEDELEENDIPSNVVESYKALSEAFQRTTGLELLLQFHSAADHGSGYDDVDGGFFSLNFNEVYGYTPRAQVLINRGAALEINFFVTFG